MATDTLETNEFIAELRSTRPEQANVRPKMLKEELREAGIPTRTIQEGDRYKKDVQRPERRRARRLFFLSAAGVGLALLIIHLYPRDPGPQVAMIVAFAAAAGISYSALGIVGIWQIVPLNRYHGDVPQPVDSRIEAVRKIGDVKIFVHWLDTDPLLEARRGEEERWIIAIWDGDEVIL